MKEIEIIKNFFVKPKIPLDDCFYLDKKYIITTDSLSEGTHFLHKWSSPQDIAIKSLEVNISDIAAGGGIPKYVFLNLGLSKVSARDEWLKKFSKTFKKLLQRYSIELCGGDTYFSKVTNITITMLGITTEPQNRSGGREGDFLYISGDLGLSAIGYNYLKKKKKKKDSIVQKGIKKHLRPRSRLELSYKLYKNYDISASMDITDGVFQDSQKLSHASQVCLEIDISCFPNLNRYLDYLSVDEVINSGEELELLFLSQEELPTKIHGVKITKIGKVLKRGVGLRLSYKNKPFFPKKGGFLHF